MGLKITECGLDYDIEYGSDNVRNVLLRHIEFLEARHIEMKTAMADICEWTERYTSPGHPVTTIAKRAIQGAVGRLTIDTPGGAK